MEVTTMHSTHRPLLPRAAAGAAAAVITAGLPLCPCPREVHCTLKISSEAPEDTESFALGVMNTHTATDVNIENEPEIPPGSEDDNIIKTRLWSGDMPNLFRCACGSLLQALNPSQMLVHLGGEPYDTFKTRVASLRRPPRRARRPRHPRQRLLHRLAVHEELGLEVPTTWNRFMGNNQAILNAGTAAPVIQTYGAKSAWTSQLIIRAESCNALVTEPDWAEAYTANGVHFTEALAALTEFAHLQEADESGYLNEDLVSPTQRSAPVQAPTTRSSPTHSPRSKRSNPRACRTREMSYRRPIFVPVKQVVVMKLVLDTKARAALEATLRACNDAANWLSERAWLGDAKPTRTHLQRLAYDALKSRGLSAQPALHVIRKVADAYATLSAKVRAGNLGKPGSRRRVKAESKPIAFSAEAAQPFDDRCLSWQIDAETVSIWTVQGRFKGIRFTGGPGQLKMLREHRKGETDLVYRSGEFYLIATCDVPEAEPIVPIGFIGVDLGIANIATTSTGTRFAGRGLNRHRQRQAELRRKLQAKQTKAAKRLLKLRSRRERRHAANTNHVIAKCIVTEAQRTSRGIALEDLKGLRDRVRLRKPQRVTLHSWAFGQLGSYIEYKARRAGVRVVFVDPAYTSQECVECHHIDKRNRPNQAEFRCRSCGVVAHADRNASRNIAARGEAVWAAGRESRVPAPS
jgi:IS605 OrfB family transposase